MLPSPKQKSFKKQPRKLQERSSKNLLKSKPKLSLNRYDLAQRPTENKRITCLRFLTYSVYQVQTGVLVYSTLFIIDAVSLQYSILCVQHILHNMKYRAYRNIMQHWVFFRLKYVMTENEAVSNVKAKSINVSHPKHSGPKTSHQSNQAQS